MLLSGLEVFAMVPAAVLLCVPAAVRFRIPVAVVLSVLGEVSIVESAALCFCRLLVVRFCVLPGLFLILAHFYVLREHCQSV